MTFAAQMRVGSLEIVGALLAFVLVAARMGSRAVQDAGRFEPLQLECLVREGGAVRRVRAPLPMVVGRAGDADLVVSDPKVSRRHAKFDAEGGVVYVTDLRSSNGTLLNGEPVTQSIEVRPGDHVDVGTTRLEIVRAIPMPWE